MGSTGMVIVAIKDEEEVAPSPKDSKKSQLSLSPIISFLRETKAKYDLRKFIHSMKVGIALVVVSLLYILDNLYEQVGDNAMWAIMTVVVIFEFYAGATLSKGLNRGIGTILGGGLGCLAASFAQDVGGIGNSIIAGIAVFIFGAAATYARQVPRIKRKYDYGAMIFMLTFNLVVVSGLRVEKVMFLARERLSTIVMGFATCIFISLLVFPIWASDELHDTTVSKFETLACSIERCLEEYFKFATAKGDQAGASFSGCKSVMDSKIKDESMANFAKWEPWHGKFGFSYPWDKYLRIGETLRELAATILSLKPCLRSTGEPLQPLRQSIKEASEAAGLSLVWTLRELGQSIKKMRRCQSETCIEPKLKAVRVELSSVVSHSKLGQVENVDGLAITSFVFSLMEIVDKVEELAKEVEELGELAGFHSS